MMKTKLVIFSIVLLGFCGNCTAENQIKMGSENKENGYWAPQIPEKITFCDENIDLNNYYLANVLIENY